GWRAPAPARAARGAPAVHRDGRAGAGGAGGDGARRMTASIATILFTDIVDSTVLMQRLGDERAQRVFEGHHRMLTDTLAASGGEELHWLGDGHTAPFASPPNPLPP